MRVCVIGAGAAGLGAAYYLNQAGITDVTIFEASDRVGGKCFTKQDGDLYYDMGAIEITPAYFRTLELVERVGREDTLIPIPLTRVIDRQTGAVTPFVTTLFSDPERGSLTEQIDNFRGHLYNMRGWLGQPGLQNAPADVRGKSFQQWLDDIGSPLVGRLFWVYIFCFGYGYVEEIPAIYPLKFSSVINFGAALARLEMSEYLPADMRDAVTPAGTVLLKYGFGDLMNKVHATLQKPAALQTKVKNVWRDGNSVKVKYSTKHDSSEKEQTFDYLIVAIPQTSNNLSFMDLNPTEKDLFSKVYMKTYATTLQKPADFEYLHYVELATNGEAGECPVPATVQLAREWNDPKCNTTFYTDAARENLNESQIEKLVGSNLKQMGKKSGQTVETKVWQYFPRAAMADLFPNSTDGSQDFYNRLDALQGENRTYYCGGLLNFELVETTLRYAHHIIGKITGTA